MHLAQGQNKISTQYKSANTIYKMIFNLRLPVHIHPGGFKNPEAQATH